MMMELGSKARSVGVLGRLVCLSMLGVVAGGCASTAVVDEQGDQSTQQQLSIEQVRDAARSVVLRHGDGSGVASWDDVVSEMASADVVLFGEMHGNLIGNTVAQELFEDVLIASPSSVLSMEFYERDDQVAIEDYLSGVTDRKAFDEAADKTEANNPRAHARMIDSAKEAGRPVLASNAVRRYVKLARTEGFDRLEGLSDEQRALFEIPMGDGEGAYKDRFVELMGGMGGHVKPEMIESFFRSQSVWDATMGQGIVDGVSMGTPVAHVVGYFHVAHGSEAGGSGLIDEIRKRGRAQLGRELSIVTLITLDHVDQEILEEDLGIAEYVVYVGVDE